MLVLVPSLLAMTGCGEQRDVTFRHNQDDRNETRVVSAAIATVAQSDGQLMVELPIGRRDRVTQGQLLRVYAADDPNQLKGTLQITDLYGDDRSLARMIGLTDRSNPLQVGDRAHLINDLSDLATAGDVESAARDEQARIDQLDDAERAEFAALREQYQTELRRLRERHAAELERVRGEHQAEAASLAARHERELERRDQERLADLTALRATLADEARVALRSDRRDRDDQRRDLERERDRLRDQVASLTEAVQQAELRIAALVTETANARRVHEAEIRAEVETREVLEQRILTLRQRIEGTPISGDTVLSNDPERNETILERLERFERERNRAHAEAQDLRDELTTRIAVTDQLQQRLARAESQLNVISDSADRRAQLAQTISDLEAQRQRLSETVDGLQLERLRAERAYFDLAARILRMRTEDPLVLDLKRRLKAVLTEGGEDIPAGDDP